MASQSAGTGDHRNKDRCLYAALPSICRAADRHDPEGISGPDAVLDNGGPGENSNIIITATERTPDEEDACQSQVLKDHWQRQNRVCIGGKNTVEDCIRLQSPHEIRNSLCTGCEIRSVSTLAFIFTLRYKVLMNIGKRAVAATELLLVSPATLFMMALFVRNLQPLQYEPARTA